MNDLRTPSQAELTEALRRQRKAFEAELPVSADARLDRIDRALDLLLEHKDALCDAMVADYGARSSKQGLLADIGAAVQSLQHAKKRLRRWMRPEKRKVDFPLNLLGARGRIDRQPLGVVGLIGPWNVPVNLIFSPLAGILAGGNRCMIKPSEFTPGTSELIAKLVAQYFDESEITVATGGPETGAAFSSLPFDHLLFTGGSSVAKHVMRAASENLVPVTLELGGKSPVVIGDSADLQKAADAIIAGKMIHAGQTCIAPDYVLLPSGKIEEFAADAGRSVERMYPTLVGNPDYAAIISQRHFDRVREVVTDAQAKGAQVIEINPAAEDFGAGPFRKLPPTLILEPGDDTLAMQDEIFGPVLPILGYERIDEAIDFIKRRPRPLALYYFGSDKGEEVRVLNRTVSGGVCVNDVIMHVTQEDLPFGGVGMSGTGEYHGIHGFRRFTHAKAVYRQSKLNVAEMVGLRPPYGKKFDGFIRKVLKK